MGLSADFVVNVESFLLNLSNAPVLLKTGMYLSYGLSNKIYLLPITSHHNGGSNGFGLQGHLKNS